MPLFQLCNTNLIIGLYFCFPSNIDYLVKMLLNFSDITKYSPDNQIKTPADE